MSCIDRVVLIIVFSLATVACGKKGPLIYPDMLVPASPAAATGQQSCAGIKIQFTLSDKDRTGSPLQGVAGVKISRKEWMAAEKDVCRACITDYQLLRTLTFDRLPTDIQRFGNRIILFDSDVKADNLYSYRIVPFTVGGVDGAAAVLADVHMTVPISGPGVKIESLPTEIRLQFSLKSQSNGQFIGYNLYRSPVAGARVSQPLNRQPLKDGEFADSGGLERGIKYRYSVRSLMMNATSGIAESCESQEVEGMLKDDE